MKWLLYEKLTPWLHVTVPPKTPTAPSFVCSTKVSDDGEDLQQNGQQEIADKKNARNNGVPNVITLGTTDTKPDEDNENNKNDWKLAANVVDRILSIVISILFIGGSIIFFTIFASY